MRPLIQCPARFTLTPFVDGKMLYLWIGLVILCAALKAVCSLKRLVWATPGEFSPVTGKFNLF